MKLSTQAERLLANVKDAEQVCRNYVPKDPARDQHYREASAWFSQFSEAYQRFLDKYQEVLEWAEEAEQEAEAEPSLADEYGPGVRRQMEMNDA
ncbi:MAG: hypothetical protein K0R61_3054 [Microvirga sp.]|jgi:hypothetical protein|nr:hypothetical protein [Microvirga sp.]MDF2972604.1 hypothetical protein [Microvirga sp.]